MRASIGINTYEIFLKVVDYGNITKAAEALHYTQSGVSHAIAALEEEMGFSLFIRSKKGVVLTQNGQMALDAVRSLMNQYRNLEQKVYSIKNCVVGTIRIGTYISISSIWLPAVIKAFQTEYPLVKFELLHGDHDIIQKWVQQGRVDCGFLSAPVSAPLSFHELKKDPMLVVLPPDHRLCEKAELTIDDIINEPFITLTKGASKDILRIITPTKKPLTINYVLNNDISVLAMVSNGFGISVLPELLLRIGSFELATKVLNPFRQRILGICSLPMDSISTTTQVFIKFLFDPQNINFEAL